MVYDELRLEEIVAYINGELLKGRLMKDIEVVDFGVNPRVITKRLARKNIKKIDGQFVLQVGSKVVTNDLGLKIYSSEDKPIAKTIRLYKEIQDKIDKVKDQFPHLSYQVILNSLLDEVTEKYLKESEVKKIKEH